MRTCFITCSVFVQYTSLIVQCTFSSPLHTTHSTLHSTQYTLHIIRYTLHSRGCSKFTDFFASWVTGSLYVREHCCKVSAKNNDRYPPTNAVLCLHLNYSTSKLCRDTWLSWALTWPSSTHFLIVNDYFQLFFDKSNKLLRYVEFSILL